MASLLCGTLSNAFAKSIIIKSVWMFLSLFCASWWASDIICDINDLPDYIKHSQIRLFADDSIIYRPIKTQADCIKLQEDLESAVKWEQDWGNLTLGYMTKTLNHIIFFFLHQNQNIFFSNIGNQNIFLEKNHNPPNPVPIWQLIQGLLVVLCNLLVF
jgi:hypothetical protein